MEIYVSEYAAFSIKNCNGKIPDKIEFIKDDLDLLNKFK